MNFVTINQNERKKELKRQEDIYLFKTYFDFDNPDMETNWKLLKNNQESIYKINRLLNTLARYTRENEKGYQCDVQQFFDYHESKGWVVGRVKMKDWKRALSYWESNDKKRRNNYGKTTAKTTYAASIYDYEKATDF